MITQIIRSLILLITISSSVGGVYYFFNPTLTSFIKATVLATAVQIIFFVAYNNILRFIARIKLESEALQLAQLAEKNKIFVDCQGCKKTSTVNIDLTEENEFVCSKCDALNKVNIEFTTILPTKVIYDK